MLIDKKEEVITMLLKGETPTNIAKTVGIARSTVYGWQKNPEFSQELESRQKEIAKAGNDFVLSKLSSYLDELSKLALTSSDARTKAAVLMYLVDRSLGKTASRIELEPIEKEKIPSPQELKDEFKMYKADMVEDADDTDGDV